MALFPPSAVYFIQVSGHTLSQHQRSSPGVAYRHTQDWRNQFALACEFLVIYHHFFFVTPDKSEGAGRKHGKPWGKRKKGRASALDNWVHTWTTLSRSALPQRRMTQNLYHRAVVLRG